MRPERPSPRILLPKSPPPSPGISGFSEATGFPPASSNPPLRPRTTPWNGEDLSMLPPVKIPLFIQGGSPVRGRISPGDLIENHRDIPFWPHSPEVCPDIAGKALLRIEHDGSPVVQRSTVRNPSWRIRTGIGFPVFSTEYMRHSLAVTPERGCPSVSLFRSGPFSQ